MQLRSLFLLPPPARDDAAPARQHVAASDTADVTLSQIYADHRQALWSFAQRLIGDPVGAEDLVHDVFVALPKLLPKVIAGTSLRNFLLGVATNRARNHLRAARRRRRLAEAWGQEAPSLSLDCPEQRAERRRLALRLERGLDTLSVPLRVVFVLCEIEAFSSAQVSEILNLPPGTVRSRLFHAKQRLQSHFAAEAAHERA